MERGFTFCKTTFIFSFLFTSLFYSLLSGRQAFTVVAVVVVVVVVFVAVVVVVIFCVPRVEGVNIFAFATLHLLNHIV